MGSFKQRSVHRGGDLTANLKLKRKNIMEHYQDLIDFMYADWHDYTEEKTDLHMDVKKIPENILKLGTIGLGSAGNHYEH